MIAIANCETFKLRAVGSRQSIPSFQDAVAALDVDAHGQVRARRATMPSSRNFTLSASTYRIG
jgi:hypothetical protein